MSGNYKFESLPPGDYFVTETNLNGFTDVSYVDGGNDLNEISVNKLSSADSNGNNFVVCMTCCAY